MMRERAEPIPGPSTEYLKELCARTGVTVIAGTAEVAGEHLYNTAVMVGPSGFLGKYRKTHLWPPEPAVFRAGTELPVFSTSLCTIGIGICYDMEFPETARALALKGADVIFYPSADMSPYEDKHDLYTRARAQENGVYVVNANPVGHAGENTFFGGSQIVAPSGEVLGRAGPSKAFLIVDIDLSRVAEEREAMGYLGNRRPLSLYFGNGG
jgi:predicted amidohydrolase